MNTKTLIAGLIAGVVYFLLGWLLYGMLFASTMQNLSGSATGVMKADDEMIMWALALGNIAFGMALAYIFGTWAKIATVMSGAVAGATVGALLSLGMNLIWYATSNVMTLAGSCLDVVIFTVMSAVAGAAAAWWLGRSSN